MARQSAVRRRIACLLLVTAGLLGAAPSRAFFSGGFDGGTGGYAALTNDTSEAYISGLNGALARAWMPEDPDYPSSAGPLSIVCVSIMPTRGFPEPEIGSGPVTLTVGDSGFDRGCGPATVTVDPALSSAHLSGSVPSRYKGSITFDVTIVATAGSVPEPVAGYEDPTFCLQFGLVCMSAGGEVDRNGTVTGGKIASPRAGSVSGSGLGTVFAESGGGFVSDGAAAGPSPSSDPPVTGEGTVKAPRGANRNGAPFDWTGTTFTAGANHQAPGSCYSTPAGTPLSACDHYLVHVNAPPGYWKTHSGGLVVRIDGFDSSQDFDLYVSQREEFDPFFGYWYSGAPAGSADELTIPMANGDYDVFVVPYKAVNSSYTGHAFIRTHSSKPPAVRDRAVTPMGRLSAHGEIWDPTVAANPARPASLLATAHVYRGFRGDGIESFSSADGGRSWRAQGRLPYLSPTATLGHVAATIDGSGKAYVLVPYANDGGDSGLQMYASGDGGKSWDPPVELLRHPAVAQTNDLTASWPSIVAGPKSDGSPLYACWSEQAAQTVGSSMTDLLPVASPIPYMREHEYARVVVTSHSTDGGATWSKPVPVSGPPPATYGLPGEDSSYCSMTAGAAGDVHVIWSDVTGYRVRIANSTDRAASFGAATTVSSFAPVYWVSGIAQRQALIPQIGEGPDGSLTAAWTDKAGGDPDVMTSRSADGLSWSAPVPVSPDRKGRAQFEPAMTVTPAGQINVFYFDRRNDPDDYFADAYVARSADGVKWTSTRLSGSMLDLGNPWSYFGQVQAIASDSRGVYSLWSDGSGYARLNVSALRR